MNIIGHWILTLEIVLWSFGSPSGLHLPEWKLPWECESSLLHIPSHFLTLPGVCDVTPELLLGPHPCDLFALTLRLLFGSQTCNPFALVVSPKLRLRQLDPMTLNKVGIVYKYCFRVLIPFFHSCIQMSKSFVLTYVNTFSWQVTKSKCLHLIFVITIFYSFNYIQYGHF